MTTREIFEKHVYLTSYCWEEHMRAKLFERTKDERHYVWPGMESRFADFQAGMAAGMERAAEVCESRHTAAGCADAELIRAMKGEVK